MRLLFITTLLLSACSLGDRPQIVTYTVNSAAAKPQSCHSKSALQITEPTAVPGLDSWRIAVMQGDERINYYSGVKWAAPVSQMLQNVLVDSFEKSGAFASISTESEAVSPDIQLTTDIRNFEITNTTDGSIHLRIVAKLINTKTQKVIATIPVEKTAKPTAYKMDSIISAFNTATAEAASEIITKSTAAVTKCKSK